MRSTFLLLKDIQARLVDAFVDFPFDSADKNATSKYVVPQIWIGHAPPKTSQVAGAANKILSGDPPFVLVRFLDGEHKIDNTSSKVFEGKVGILCCVYNKESHGEIEAGYNDIMNMADRVMMLLSQNLYWANGTWILPENEPIEYVLGLQKNLSSIYDAGMHEHPFYGAAVIATFKTMMPPRPKKFTKTEEV